MTIARDDRRLARNGATGRLAAFARALGLALLVLWAGVTLAVALPGLGDVARAERADFFTFLASAREWRAGRDPYAVVRTLPGPDNRPVLAHPNLNHPVTIPLLAPLVPLSPAVAFVVWTLLGILAWATAVPLALRLAGARTGPRGWIALTALAVTLPGAVYGLQLGQVGLPLALATVGCWAGVRRGPGGRAALAGAIGLGVIVALKPFFFPLLLIFIPRRDWRGLGAAVAGAGALSLVALPLVGLGAFRSWLALGGTVDWYAHGFNAGLAGLLWRVAPTPPPSLVAWAVALGIALVAAVLLRSAPPSGLARIDRDLGLLLTAAILGSPLGWLYYTPLLALAFAALFAARGTLPPRARRLAILACGLLWVPHALLPVFPEAAWSQLTLRATATWGLVALVVALASGGMADRAEQDEMSTSDDGAVVPGR